jgi:hypothetical protein
VVVKFFYYNELYEYGAESNSYLISDLSVLANICIYHLSYVPWNVSVSISGLRSRSVDIIFMRNVDVRSKIIFSEKIKKMFDDCPVTQ